MSLAVSPMLFIPAKNTDQLDFSGPFKQYIIESYGDDPDKYNDEINTLNKLRQDVRGAGKDGTGRDLLLKYYGQLELLDLRFPIDETHVKVVFNWYDAFNNQETSQHSLAYEKACVIFNIAATLSHLAGSASRIDNDGIKRAYHYFQTAAGIFNFINDNFLHAPSTDLSKETIKIIVNIMLAQAQEVFFEKTLNEKKKGNVVVKLAAGLATMYTGVAEAFSSDDKLRDYFDRTYSQIIQIKAKHFTAIAQYHKALAVESDNKYGEVVSRLINAEKDAKEANKLAQSFSYSFSGNNSHTSPDAATAITDITKSSLALITEKKNQAIKDNDIIYHESIPAFEALPPLEKLITPKCLGFSDIHPNGASEIQRIIGPDIFVRLIPLSVHEKSSLYSEEKSKLLRTQNEQCEILTAEIQSTFESLNLPVALEKFKGSAAFITNLKNPPKEIADCVNYIIAEESGSSLEELSQTLEGLRNGAKDTMDKVAVGLDEEQRECESLRVRYGDLWTQPPSSNLTNTIRNDLRNHRSSFEKAHSSDIVLLSKYQQLKRDIDLLKSGHSAVQLEFERVVSNQGNAGSIARKGNEESLLDMSVEEEGLDAMVKKLGETMDGLNKLKKERLDALADLKQKIHSDDISDLLILNKKTPNIDQQIFATELQKFNVHTQNVATNITKTRELLDTLKLQWNKLRSSKDAIGIQVNADVTEKRKVELVNRLKNVKDVYAEVKDGVRKAIQFYSELSDLVESLSKTSREFVNSRKVERENLAATLETTRAEREQKLLKDQLSRLSSSSSVTLQSPTGYMPSNISAINDAAKGLSNLNIMSPSAPLPSPSTLASTGTASNYTTHHFSLMQSYPQTQASQGAPPTPVSAYQIPVSSAPHIVQPPSSGYGQPQHQGAHHGYQDLPSGIPQMHPQPQVTVTSPKAAQYPPSFQHDMARPPPQIPPNAPQYYGHPPPTYGEPQPLPQSYPNPGQGRYHYVPSPNTNPLSSMQHSSYPPPQHAQPSTYNPVLPTAGNSYYGAPSQPVPGSHPGQPYQSFSPSQPLPYNSPNPPMFGQNPRPGYAGMGQQVQIPQNAGMQHQMHSYPHQGISGNKSLMD